MPKFTDKIDPVDQEQIVAAGQNPADYLLDEESGQLIPRSQAGSLGLVGNVVEGAKSVPVGGVKSLTSLPKFLGQLGKGIEEQTGFKLGGFNSPEFLTGLSALAERKTEETMDVDPRTHWLARGAGEGVGQIAGTIVPAAAVGRVAQGMSLAPAAVSRAAKLAGVGLGGVMTAEDTIEEELQRQAAAGEKDQGKAILKGVTSGALGAVPDWLLGTGRLMKYLERPARGTGDIVKRGLANTATGALSEGSQRAVQEGAVHGADRLNDPAQRGAAVEQILREGVVGGLVQGGTGAAIDTLSRDNPALPPRIAPDAPAGPAPDADSLMGNRGGTPAEDIGRESYTPSDTTIAALVKRQTLSKDQRPKLAIKTPVDDIVDKLIDSGVVLTDENVRNLFDAWGGMEEGVPRLERAAREMQDQAVLQMGAKPRTVLETVGEELKIKKKYDGVLKDIDGQAAAIGKALPEMPLGDRARAQAELVQLQRQRDEVMRQREMELGAIRPAGEINTGVSTVPPGPTIDIGGPGVRTTASRTARESGYPVAGQITDAEVLQRGNVLPESTTPPPTPPNPQVVPEAIGPAIPMGTGQRASERAAMIPPAPEVDPVQEAVRLQREKERQILTGQEGEKGSPFGEGNVRYSGIDPKRLLEPAKELARRARQFISQAQLQDKTFILSGVAALNNDRPWGMQVAGDGKLPTSGLTQKMAANIPKGEMEVYKAAGLEEWLKGKGRVGREELQQWMMENGPQLEVKELRPVTSSPEAKELAQLQHKFEINSGITQGSYDIVADLPTVKLPGGYLVRLFNGQLQYGGRTVDEYYRATLKDPKPFTTFSDSPEAESELKRYLTLLEKKEKHDSGFETRTGDDDATIGKYGVEPRPVEQMEGPVELLVRVPRKHSTVTTSRQRSDGTWELVDDNTGEVLYTAPTRELLDRKFNENKSPLWRGGHHGQSGQNTVGFARANVETLPDGRRVLHVFELQSDWGQRVREQRKRFDDRVKTAEVIPVDEWSRARWGLKKYKTINKEDSASLSGYGDTPEEALVDYRKRLEEEGFTVSSHSLLKDYNRLTLKAAIKYAVDHNLDGIAISDPETAMMTEGHDVAGSMVRRATQAEAADAGFSNPFTRGEPPGVYVFVKDGRSSRRVIRLDKPEANTPYNIELAKELAAAGYGEKEGPYIPQEEGMRFNYGNTLPKIAEELTGSKPEKVSFGEHWKAFSDDVEPQNIQHPTYGAIQEMQTVRKTRPGLIFKNPDGTPKTDISANLFSLDKPKKMVAEQALFTPFGRDQSYYSGIPPEMIGRAIRSVLGIGGDVKIGPNFLYNMHRSTTSRMAATGPEGAYLKYLADARLNPERNKAQGILQEAFKGTEEFLDSPEGIKWLNDMSNRAVWDISGVSAKHRPAAARFVAQMQKIPDIFNSRGVMVKEIDSNGKATYRPHQKLPGYFPWQIGEHVYKADHTEYAKLKKDFVDAWAKKFGKNSLPMAEEAIKNILGGGGAKTGIGAEPLFGPVRLPHGMTLPESWRAKTPSESLNRYIARVATDLGWAEVMQYDGVARRTLGIDQDPSGKDTRADDRVTWADRPEAWKYAVREGRRVRAKWALEADMNKPPKTEIDLFRGDSKLLPALQMAYSQMGSAQPVMQAAGNLASSILMQTKTATRDFATGVIAASAIAGPGRALKVTLENIIAPKQAVTRAVRAGSMQADPMEIEAVENGKVLVRNIQKAAKGIRTATARNILDNLGKTLIHDSVVQIIEAGRGQHLIDEFGPAFDPGMSLKEKARITANRLVERYSNAATPQNITPGMLPRSGTAASYMLGLTRWNQAQWNNFTEDVVHGLMDKNRSSESMKRLLTWTLGASIGGAAVNKLWEWIESRKPRWMSWGELLRLTGNDKVETKQKVAEFAYSLTAAQQTIGAFGTVGDYILHPMAKIAAGETVRGNNADIQYPALIITEELAKTLYSFGSAVRDGRATADDFPELLWEVAKAAQNVRIIRRIAEQNGILGAAPERSLREMAIYERVTGRDTKTGKPVDAASGVKLTPVSDPFSFSKQVMGGADIRDYRDFLKDQTTVPKLDRWTQGRKYYKELEEIIGAEEARKVAEKDRRVDRAIAEKNREIGRVAR